MEAQPRDAAQAAIPFSSISVSPTCFSSQRCMIAGNDCSCSAASVSRDMLLSSASSAADRRHRGRQRFDFVDRLIFENKTSSFMPQYSSVVFKRLCSLEKSKTISLQSLSFFLSFLFMNAARPESWPAARWRHRRPARGRSCMQCGCSQAAQRRIRRSQQHRAPATVEQEQNHARLSGVGLVGETDRRKTYRGRCSHVVGPGRGQLDEHTRAAVRLHKLDSAPREHVADKS